MRVFVKTNDLYNNYVVNVNGRLVIKNYVRTTDRVYKVGLRCKKVHMRRLEGKLYNDRGIKPIDLYIVFQSVTEVK